MKMDSGYIYGGVLNERTSVEVDKVYLDDAKVMQMAKVSKSWTLGVGVVDGDFVEVSGKSINDEIEIKEENMILLTEQLMANLSEDLATDREILNNHTLRSVGLIEGV